MIGLTGHPGIGSVMPEREREPDYVRVANDLRQKIREAATLVLGEKKWPLDAGEPLPTKNELREIYGVGGGSVDTAMVLLRNEGFVVGQQGKARFVGAGKADPPEPESRSSE